MTIEKTFVINSSDDSMDKLKSYFAEGFVVAKKEFLGVDVYGRINKLVTIKKNSSVNYKFLSEA